MENGKTEVCLQQLKFNDKDFVQFKITVDVCNAYLKIEGNLTIEAAYILIKNTKK